MDRPSRRDFSRAIVLVLLAAALAGGWWAAFPAPTAAATTFTVNSAADPGDGVCDATQCTLREAITAANAEPGADTIAFSIPGPGPHTIRPESSLPTITDRLAIDGYTEPGSAPNTSQLGTTAKLLIEIDGSRVGDGLFIDADGSVVRGLVINRANDGIFVDADDVIIAGNFLGTDRTGRLDFGNTSDGVAINAGRNLRVGGRAPADRNLISGNEDAGIRVAAGDSKILGNLVGTDRDGVQNLGNDDDGIVVSASNVRVERNLVAFNGRAGVTVFGSGVAGIRILTNSIFANGLLGIELAAGVNDDQKAPTVIAATVANGRASIRGSLFGPRNQSFTIQIFGNPKPSGAEGKTFLAERTVTTDASGRALFSAVIAKSKGVKPGQAITATATNRVTGNSSAFSAPLRVTPNPKNDAVERRESRGTTAAPATGPTASGQTGDNGGRKASLAAEDGNREGPGERDGRDGKRAAGRDDGPGDGKHSGHRADGRRDAGAGRGESRRDRAG